MFLEYKPFNYSWFFWISSVSVGTSPFSSLLSLHVLPFLSNLSKVCELCLAIAFSFILSFLQFAENLTVHCFA